MIQRSRFALLTVLMLVIALAISACASKPAATPTAVPATTAPTAEATEQPTAEPTVEPTEVATEVPTAVASAPVVATASPVVTEPPTPSPVVTEPPTPSPVVTEAPTPSPVVTEPPTPSPVVTEAPTPSPVVTEAPTPSPVVTEAPTPSPVVTEPPTPSPVVTEAPTPSPVVTEAPTPSPVVTEAPTPSPVVTEAPTPSPVVTEAPTPSPVVTEAPTPSPVVTEAPTPSPVVTEAPTPSPVVTEAPTPSPVAPSVAPSVAPVDLLQRLQAAGVIRVSIEPNYAPYSMQQPDGSFTGFNVDVATEIAKRLGVAVQFEIPSFDLVVAGGWNDRWDMSVGSVTITQERKQVLDFTQPYAYNPAVFAATTASGITTLDGFANQAICVGAATTYQQWLEGTLTLVDAPTPATPPAGATAFPLETDQLCAQSVQSGRADFTGWLSSADTVEDAIKNGTPMVEVGDPVFYESLGVAFDNTVDDNDSLVAAVDGIIGDMRTDGTLLQLSQKWFDGKDRVSGQ